MSISRKAFLIFLAVFILVSTQMLPTCLAKYELSNYNAVRNGLYYKWMPADWWASYFLKEFDKVAPPPGADWMKDKTTSLSPWFDAAREKGWVVKTRADAAKVGAIAIRRNPETGTSILNIVREVYDWGFKGDYMGKDGEPHVGEVPYSYLLSTAKGYHFVGYIWPERVQPGK
ncbi:MAG: hypothetical protein GYA36_08055 [Veillonellaceae bacterium]|nr:hypothetical protein [Veillonellaceae bacterium]